MVGATLRAAAAAAARLSSVSLCPPAGPDGIFAALAVHLAHKARGQAVEFRPNTVYKPLSVDALNSLQASGLVRPTISLQKPCLNARSALLSSPKPCPACCMPTSFRLPCCIPPGQGNGIPGGLFRPAWVCKGAGRQGGESRGAGSPQDSGSRCALHAVRLDPRVPQSPSMTTFNPAHSIRPLRFHFELNEHALHAMSA